MSNKKEKQSSRKGLPAVKGKPTPPKMKPPKKEETTLEGLINKAEKVILVTATRGNIEVTGLKDVNYSHEAKGLLHGALDTYNTRPVISTITNLSKGLITNLQNILNEVKKSSPVEVGKKEEE